MVRLKVGCVGYRLVDLLALKRLSSRSRCEKKKCSVAFRRFVGCRFCAAVPRTHIHDYSATRARDPRAEGRFVEGLSRPAVFVLAGASCRRRQARVRRVENLRVLVSPERQRDARV